MANALTHHVLICLEGNFEEDHLLQVLVHDAAKLRGQKVNIMMALKFGVIKSKAGTEINHNVYLYTNIYNPTST